MHNFTFYNPVRLVFGKGTIAKLPDLIPAGTKVLMTYGGGSIKKNGVYDQVMTALKEFDVVEFGGIEPNPHYETCMLAAAKARQEGVGFILAVGGGSVLDATKFIAVAALYEEGDPWDIMSENVPVKAAMPIGSVMTLPATGSEMNAFSVVTRVSTNEKLSFGSPHCFPLFSILDPETTLSLPQRQVENGICDTFAHVMEQYMTDTSNAPLTERMAESVLKSVIDALPQLNADPQNYDVRANLMWCATVALNGWLGCGMGAQDWATHMIGHELTALYGIDHGRTLAIIMPAVYRHQIERKKQRLAQCAARVWHIIKGSDEERAQAAIEKIEDFYREAGVPTRLSEYEIDAADAAEKVAARLAERGVKIGEYGDLGPDQIKEIILLAK